MPDVINLKFNLLYRVSNTPRWVSYGTYETRGEAIEARKAAIKSGFRAPPTPTTQGKILGWNIISFIEN